jgi:hypothetical protein
MGDDGGAELLFLVGVVVAVVLFFFGSAEEGAVEERLQEPLTLETFNRRMFELLRRKNKSVLGLSVCVDFIVCRVMCIPIC